MDVLQRIGFWGDHHHPRWVDIVRIVLGIFLIYKGIDFLNNMGSLVSLMSLRSQFSSFAYILAGHYVVFAHILGGILLVFGILTRLSCLLQIPILLGALFFISSNRDMLAPYSQILITVLVLGLLVYFLIVGNGPLSVKVEESTNEHYSS